MRFGLFLAVVFYVGRQPNLKVPVVIRVRTPRFVIRARPRVRPGPVAVTGRSPPPPRVRPRAVGSVIVVGCFRLFRCSRSRTAELGVSRQLVVKSLVQYRVRVESWSYTAEDGRAESRGYNKLATRNVVYPIFCLYCCLPLHLTQVIVAKSRLL